MELKSCIAAKKPFLTLQHRKLRRQWAQKKRHYKMVDWEHVIWTDEASVELGRQSRQVRVWRKPWEKYYNKCLCPTFKSGRQSLMVWGAIAYGRRGPLVCMPKGHQTGASYVNFVLSGPLWDFYRELYDEKGVVKVMEDGAPIHRAGVAKLFCNQQDMDILEHPASSPDINPIEHVWKYLKVRVNQQTDRAKNLDELWRILQEEWEKIPIAFINNLIESMPDCAQAVWKANGGSTKY
jgi:transposase